MKRIDPNTLDFSVEQYIVTDKRNPTRHWYRLNNNKAWRAISSYEDAVKGRLNNEFSAEVFQFMCEREGW